MKNLSDSQLYVLIQKRDYVAFDKLFDRYWDKLFKYAYNILADQQQCEDVLQEVFTSIWEKAPSKNVEYIPAYLYNSVKYKASNSIRSKKWHLDLDTIDLSDVTDDESLEIPSEDCRLVLLEESMSQLPPKCQEVMVLKSKRGLSAHEIAAHLGISTRTVEGHMQKGMKLLKASLTQVALFHLLKQSYFFYLL
ncbi:RNA polymerase sigma-70 factor (ECF subfamily) [Algoriphagus ratkowskyi]|uniref:RNA polymerase sigma-70 factor (ECF subfamily) n=1 Tax=Algoriphagus ratkowskyi TaxID=57028 RepID=A0A2W7QU88_9BACT|nr:sigma-70 family RNA polymerase sigma factor [Algoriphagus ratkowskyi]PZX52138.1 RNA polymerase sigma-70 factor (ECF subfamily) [Algoriphagus ratkowskyi]TXD76100.1 sigma-70 family RNA polymerase sigma factor [Algoriphagus ratkowskyi]